jgi:carboxyl-terminal processing protease
MQRRWTCLSGVLLALAALVTASAGTLATGSGLEDLLAQGSHFEALGQWDRAVELYERAFQQHPGSTLLREKLWECRLHQSLTRRYRDESFTKDLLRLSDDQAMSFLGEVLAIVQKNYYESLAPEFLQQLAFKSLSVALENPTFQSQYLGHLSAAEVEELRHLCWTLARQPRLATRTAEDPLLTQAHHLIEVARQRWRLPATPLILELAYGLVRGLDKYSACLTPQTLEDLYAVIDGEFVGIGVELRERSDGALEIVRVLKSSPASEAGLRPGDKIVAIDQKRVAGHSVEEAASRLQGAEGSAVRLQLRRPGHSLPLEIVLVRRHVEVPSIDESRLVLPAEGIGYIRLSSFQRSSALELRRSLEQLSGQGLRALILDIRSNPGGLLSAAVEVADCFLEAGIIVSTRGRAGGQSWTYWAKPTATWNLPLVLLVDRESASASEIVAGALKFHRRALVVGERTYGKGSVQSILPLRSVRAGLRLTTAEFLDPAGNTYNGRGVEPDIWVPQPANSQAIAPPTMELSQDPGLHAAVAAARRQLAKSRPP